MSEPKLISPMLDDYAMGDPISNHHGVRCCPAMEKDSDKKYIVKIISIPASQVQLDALLLTGAYRSSAEALSYFKALSEDVVQEAQTLQKLSKLEGFISYENWQVVQMENEVGYDVYLLGAYRRTLEKFFRRNSMTHLGAVNLGLDLCAAMAVCRRSGYLYVDLKPGNIFISEDQEYRVGDLGFIALDSLKYASLPDKYRSRYTAPEIKDALSSLNETIDVYAVGLILYQAYNGGVLPFVDRAPGEPLPPPEYADYEMAEIILKACAPKPEDRWQDPVEMGQALVSYMQRNGANDTPITVPPAPVQRSPEPEKPVAVNVPDANETAEAQTIPAGEETNGEYVAEPTIRVPEPIPDLEQVSLEVETDSAMEESAEEKEDPDSDLSFMDNLGSDETAPDEDFISDLEYHELSDDLSDILSQADELIAHETPDPVVPLEPVSVSVPEPVTPAEEAAPDPSGDDTESNERETRVEAAPEPVAEKKIKEEGTIDKQPSEKNKKSFKGFIVTAVIIILVGLLVVGGYFFYRDYYMQTIDDLTITGDENQLTVQITSSIDSADLTVLCVDTFGNKKTSEVTDGIAVFDNLNPNTIYKISVEIEGFHKLVGQTTGSYTTPAQTNIIQFNAVAGSTDGSVVLTITVDGQEADSWNITYFTDGQEAKTVNFTGHMVTVNGLTTGLPYTFQLSSESQLYINGMKEITYTPVPLVYAENLEIVSCKDQTIEVQWNAPADVSVESWTVRCYDDQGYDQTITTSETTASFTGINPTAANTVEVVAAGMSMGRQVYMTANSVNVSNVQHEITEFGEISITWEHAGTLPPDGWMLVYSVDSSEHQQIIYCDENAVLISSAAPGSTYHFTLQSSENTTVFGGEFTVEIPEAEVFDSAFLGMSADDISYEMCLTPDFEGWDVYDLSEDDFTTTFTVGQNASFALSCSHVDYSATQNTIHISTVIRDADGNLVSTSHESRIWYGDTWQNARSTLDIPVLPDTAGAYTITVYYDGASVFTQNFTMVD